MRIAGVLFLLFILSVVVFCFSYFSVESTLELLQQKHFHVQKVFKEHPISFTLTFCGFYVLVTALCIPGITVLNLLAGAVFGLLNGIVVVSFSNAIGATISFLGSRWLFRDFAKRHLPGYWISLNRGFHKEGALYLLSLRLTPAVHSFIVNLGMGLTTMPTLVFYGVSQLGMLPITAIYVNAGSQLATITKISDIISTPVILSLLATALVPLIVIKILHILRPKFICD